MNYDVLIIGGGAAGLSAAIYSARAAMRTALFESTACGGQVFLTDRVDNYLALPDIGGAELCEKMLAHAKMYDCDFKYEGVRRILPEDGGYRLITRKNEYTARAVILAAGAKPRRLGVPGESELGGAGVSYCATCDGAFFRGKTAIVAGGGSTAFEDALYLSAICNKVYLVNRSEKFRAAEILVKKACSTDNIEIKTSCRITEILGSGSVSGAMLEHADKTAEKLASDAVFIAVGRLPESSLLQGLADLAEDGSVICDERLQASRAGIFAAGDVRKTPLRQIITAAADGALAASSAAAYVRSL